MRTFQPIHPLHLEELAKIWENDPRMPSAKSRRAWALARGLNPDRVNSRWYRRRKAQAKVGVALPLDAYELDVGVPPVIIVKVEDDDNDEKVKNAVVSGEAGAEPLSDPASEDTCLDSISAGLSDNSLGSGIDSLASSAITARPSLAKPVHILGKDVEEGAYTHLLSSPTLRCSSILPSSPPSSPCHGRMSSLPPSSPPPSSPLPPPGCLLFLPTSESNYDSDSAYPPLDDANEERALNTLLEHPENLKRACLNPTNTLADTQNFSCASASAVQLPFTFCGSYEEYCFTGAVEEQLTTDLEAFAAVTEYAPWCLAGFRIAYDGSLIGLCSQCYFDTWTPSSS